MTEVSGDPLKTPSDWEARLEAQMAEYRRRKNNQKQLRDEFRERRAYGLKARHAAKLARNRGAVTPSSTVALQATDQP